MPRLDIDDMASVTATERREVRHDLRQTMLSGLALTVPFFVTILILVWMVNVVSNVLNPVVTFLGGLGPLGGVGTVVVQLIALGLIVGVVLVVGVAAQHGPSSSLARRVEAVMEDIPGVGSIYTSVDRMSEVLLEGDTESFREVKLVEFPREGNFVLAFLTANSPPEIEAAAGHDDMLTVFVPMAPNPVMGGHLVNLPRDRIHHVDLTVEEGMQAIMTTGMAIDERTREPAT